LALTSKTTPLVEIEDLADTRMAQKISQISGVGLVTLHGGQRLAIRVQANPAALASYGMSLEDLRSAIGSANVNGAKGSFDGPARSYTINANDQLRSAADYGNIVIAYRNGAAVRLCDVATIMQGPEDSRLIAWKDEVPAIIMSIRRQPGSNVVKVVDDIKSSLPRLIESMPATVDVSVLTDRTIMVRTSAEDMKLELILAVILVVLVMFVFLRSVPATVIPSLSVPLSLVGTLAGMFLVGFSLNSLTMMALTISTGFVVDDAIVMVENISRHIEHGESPWQAALKGSQQIGFTIVSLTVSLIAVLIPLLFMGEIVGRLFHEFAITLALTIAISAVVSLTLVPMLCAMLLRPIRRETNERTEHSTPLLFERIILAYGRSLNWVIDRQGLALVIAVGTVILALALYMIVPKGFFPQQDTGLIQGISEGAQSASFATMRSAQQQLGSRILQDPAVASLSSVVGVDGVNSTISNGSFLINLKPHGDRDSVDVVLKRLRQNTADMPGVRLYLNPVQDLTIEDRVSRTQYQFALGAPNAADLNLWVPKLVDRLNQQNEFMDVASDLQTRGLQAYLDIDRDRAGRLGITPAAIDAVLYDAFGQRQVSTIFTESNVYRVVLEVMPEFQRGLGSLSKVFVPGLSNPNQVVELPEGSPASPGGTQAAGGTPMGATPGVTSTLSQAPLVNGQVRLDSIIKVSERQAPLAINHLGQFPSATISFNLTPGYSLGDAVKRLQQVESELGMPADMEMALQGAAAAFQASLPHMALLILAAIVTMYIVLGVLYESFIHPITILSTIPSAGIGALLALMVSGEQLDVIAVIGIILLIGIVKKNAILIVDFALSAERKQGISPREAIHKACLLRLRPILMTTFAALFGALPLMLGTGVGSELRRPLGVTIVSGLLLSQLLTLYTTPVVYLTLGRYARKKAHIEREDEIELADHQNS
jgi:multidrug efflux pump